MRKCVALVLCLVVSAVGYSKQFWDKTNDFTVISNISLTHVDEPHTGLHKIKISFENNDHIQFTCVSHSPYAKNTKIAVRNGSNTTFIDAPSNTYKAIGENHRHFTVTQYSDGTFSGFWQSEQGHWHFFDALDRHVSFMHPHHKSLIGNGSHLVFREPGVNKIPKRDYPRGDDLPLSPPPPTCPQILYEVTISIAVSVSYYDIFKNIEEVANYLATGVMSANVFLESDLNIHATIENAVIYTTKGGESWNDFRGSQACVVNPVHIFADNWQNVIPQCCGKSTMGLMFHNCEEFFGGHAGIVCSEFPNTGSHQRYGNIYTTRRAIANSVGSALGGLQGGDGVMGLIFPDSDERHDRFSKASQTAICPIISEIISKQCLKPFVVA